MTDIFLFALWNLHEIAMWKSEKKMDIVFSLLRFSRLKK